MFMLKSIMILSIVISFTLLLTQESTAVCLAKPGGFLDSATESGIKVFKCGKVESLTCWTECDDGSGKKPGDPINLFFHNTQDQTIGIGYINAEYVSELPGDEQNGPQISFTITPSTTIYFTYATWYSQVP